MFYSTRGCNLEGHQNPWFDGYQPAASEVPIAAAAAVSLYTLADGSTELSSLSPALSALTQADGGAEGFSGAFNGTFLVADGGPGGLDTLGFTASLPSQADGVLSGDGPASPSLAVASGDGAGGGDGTSLPSLLVGLGDAGGEGDQPTLPSTTQSFALDPNAVFSGQWLDLLIGGHNAREVQGNNSQFDLEVYGSTFSILAFYSSVTSWYASVDGGPYTFVPRQSPDAWGLNNVFAGLGDLRWHRVSVRQVGGGGVNLYLDRDAGFQVTGAAPALRPPQSGFGPRRLLTDALVRLDGPMVSNSIGGYTAPPAVSNNYPMAGPRIYATGDTLYLWCFRFGQTYTVYVDGAPHNTVTVQDTSEWGWEQVAAGLDGGAQHEYAVYSAQVTGGTPGTNYQYELMVTGGSAAMAGTQPPLRAAALAEYGDSIWAGYVGPTNYAADAAGTLLGDSKGPLAQWNISIQSSKVYDAGGDANAGQNQARINTLGQCAPAPVQIINALGTNDFTAILGSSETYAQYYAAYLDMLRKQRAKWPLARIINCGLLPRNDATPAQRAPFNAQTIFATWAMADPAMFYLDMEGVISSNPANGDVISDGTHLTTQGHAKVAAYLQQWVGLVYGITDVYAWGGSSVQDLPVAVLTMRDNLTEADLLGYIDHGAGVVPITVITHNPHSRGKGDGRITVRPSGHNVARVRGKRG